MRCRPSLRLRLGAGAIALAALAIAAALIAAFGILRMQDHAAEAMGAQSRIEAYAALNARLGEWMLDRLVGGDSGPRADLQVVDALDRLEMLVAKDVLSTSDQAELAARSRQSLAAAQLRKLFDQLAASLTTTPADSEAGKAALNFHAARVPEIIAAQVERETRRRDAALMAMEGLRRPLLWAAAAIALAAPLVLLALHLAVLGPLFRRLAQVALAPGPLQLTPAVGPGGHDELGLMAARLRRMAAKVDRRQDRLEATIAARTSALSTANDRLAQVDHARRRLFSDVSHELRTPLTVIMGEAELGEAHSDATARAAFQTIRVRAERLFRRIEDLLRIAKSETGRLELERRPVLLQDAIIGASNDLGPLLRRADVTLATELPPDLYVAGDPDWIRQLFAGFFENAAKYAGRGAKLQISATQSQGSAHIRIADDGPGLPPGTGPEIFDRFARAGAPAPGFGMGLALAAWVTREMGGSLSLAARPSPDGAKPGHGLTLDLELPLCTKG